MGLDEQSSMNRSEKSSIHEDHDRLVVECARLEKELASARAALAQLDAEVRAAIARDLHDGPVQQIAAAGLHVSYLRRLVERAPAMLPQAIDDLDDQLARVMHDLRTVLYGLRPLGLEEHGLPWAVEQYAVKLRAAPGPELRLVVPPGLRRLPVAHERTVFYVVQEALMNARKYARATTTTITFSDEGASLRIAIVDDGVGFDLVELEASYAGRGSLGIVNMRERARMVGGVCAIVSTPEVGTTVTIDVPFDS